MGTIKNIRILENEANKRGDLFTRLMKNMFLVLGYDNPRHPEQAEGSFRAL